MPEPTDATEPTRALPLVINEPRGRKKPPRHLADLTEAERAEACSARPGSPASGPGSSRPTTSAGWSTTRPR